MAFINLLRVAGYFLILLGAMPNPIKPEPNSAMIEGSGAGVMLIVTLLLAAFPALARGF